MHRLSCRDRLHAPRAGLQESRVCRFPRSLFQHRMCAFHASPLSQSLSECPSGDYPQILLTMIDNWVHMLQSDERLIALLCCKSMYTAGKGACIEYNILAQICWSPRPWTFFARHFEAEPETWYGAWYSRRLHCSFPAYSIHWFLTPGDISHLSIAAHFSTILVKYSGRDW